MMNPGQRRGHMSPDRGGGDFLPISAYGLLGDCNSAALVSNDGSLDKAYGTTESRTASKVGEEQTR
jgi:hypothetical protein